MIQIDMWKYKSVREDSWLKSYAGKFLVLAYANKFRRTAQIVTLLLMQLSQSNCYVNILAWIVDDSYCGWRCGCSCNGHFTSHVSP